MKGVPGALALASLLLAFGRAAATPLPPVPVQPEDGAELGPEVRFEALVEDSEGADLDVRLLVRPRIEGLVPFRIAVLPDTQFYTTIETLNGLGDLFAQQVSWILEQSGSTNTVFVTHLGDVVQDWDDQAQWQAAHDALTALNGALPWAVSWGNHEVPHKLDDPGWDDLPMDAWFPLSSFAGQPYWGGCYPQGKAWNCWQELEVGGLRLLMMHLMFEPGQPELDWAAKVIQEHPDHFVIISTHSFLDDQGAWVSQDSFQAELLWDALVEPFGNVRLVLSAHTPGEIHRSDIVADQPVHQLLSCFHYPGDNGSGWLRVLDFDPDGGTLDIASYSPWLASWDEDSRVRLPLPLAPLAWSHAEQGVASGSTVTGAWDEAPAGAWEWWVEVEDPAGETARSAIRGFTVVLPEDTAAPEEDSGDSGRPEDSDGPGDSGSDAGGCGCGGAPGGAGWLALALGVGLHSLRRRGKKCTIVSGCAPHPSSRS